MVVPVKIHTTAVMAVKKFILDCNITKSSLEIFSGWGLVVARRRFFFVSAVDDGTMRKPTLP